MSSEIRIENSVNKSRLQSSELRIENSVVIRPVHPGRRRIRLEQPGYTLEVSVDDAERIARALLEHVEECRDATGEG